MAANERVKSGLFHRSGCEYIQEWMRMVSEYTKEDANNFGEGARPLRGSARVGSRNKEASWLMDLTKTRTSGQGFLRPRDEQCCVS